MPMDSTSVSPGVGYAKCLRAPFSEAAVPSSYQWDVVLSDARFTGLSFLVDAAWSATTINYILKLNGTQIVFSTAPASSPRNYTSGGDELRDLAKAGDTLTFICQSTNTTSAAGTGYFELFFVPQTVADGVTVTPL